MIASETGARLTPEQRAAVEDRGGNAFVSAGPGTGKTHVLAARVAALLEEGVDARTILALTFSRRAAAELRQRLPGGVGARVDVRTFQGFASRVLEADGPRFASRRLLDPFSKRLLLGRAIAAAELATVHGAARRSRRFEDDAERFVADLTRATPAALGLLDAAATPRLRDMLAIARATREIHERASAADLDDLVAGAVRSLADPAGAPARWLRGRYAHVLVDEFQDLDRIQAALVAATGGTIFAVGDPAQAIYRFRGAVHGIVDELAAALDMRRFTLTQSRRCPQPVCDLAAGTPSIRATPLTSASADAAPVEIRAARTAADEASLVADRVCGARERGVPLERIAVLARSVAPALPLVREELERRGVRISGAGPDGFANDASVGVLRSLLALLERPDERERAVRLLCCAPLGFAPLRVRFALGRCEARTIDAWLDAIDAAGLRGRLEPAAFRHALEDAAAAWTAGELARTLRRAVEGFRLHAPLVELDDIAAAREAIANIGAYVDGIAAAERVVRALGGGSPRDAIVAELRARETLLAGAAEADDDSPGVRLLSVHAAKGLEYDVVIVCDAVDGRFPQTERESALLAPDDLAVLRAAGVDSTLDAAGTAIEEASLWYVAVTRTRRELVVTYALEDAAGDAQRPSRFVPREAVDAQPAPYERIDERLEYAALRAGDRGHRERIAARAPASPVLRELLGRGDLAFAPPGARAVRFEPSRISVSSIVTWLHCPRRFFYAHVLRLPDESSLASAVGTLVHAVLERFHEAVGRFDATSALDVDAWRDRLRELAHGHELAYDAATPAEAGAARTHVARLLDAYATWLATEARARPFVVRDRELEVTIAFEPGTASGTVDRIDRLDAGGLALRDYKTGRRKGAFAKPLARAVDDAGDASLGGALDGKCNPQLALYAGATAAAGTERLTFVYLNGVDDERDRVAADDAVFDGRLAAVAERLRASVARDLFAAYRTGVESPVPGTALAPTCEYCAYRTFCPAALR